MGGGGSEKHISQSVSGLDIFFVGHLVVDAKYQVAFHSSDKKYWKPVLDAYRDKYNCLYAVRFKYPLSIPVNIITLSARGPTLDVRILDV